MKLSAPTQLAAVIAAAGLSRRMGEPKQLLPWGDVTVIETMVRNLAVSGAAPVLCVVGHERERVGAAAREAGALIVQNRGYRQHDLLSSYQAGVDWLSKAANGGISGALLSLGDQPHVSPAIISQIVTQASKHPHAIVIPSHHMRRGHPIVLPRRLWPELLTLEGDDILRTLINRHVSNIIYVNIKQESILYDLDTPAEYSRLKQVYAPGKQAEK